MSAAVTPPLVAIARIVGKQCLQSGRVNDCLVRERQTAGSAGQWE